MIPFKISKALFADSCCFLSPLPGTCTERERVSEKERGRNEGECV